MVPVTQCECRPASDTYTAPVLHDKCCSAAVSRTPPPGASESWAQAPVWDPQILCPFLTCLQPATPVSASYTCTPRNFLGDTPCLAVR